MTVVVCDKAEKAQLLLDKANNLRSLKTLIIMDKISEKNKETAEKHGIKLIPFRDVVVNISSFIPLDANIMQNECLTYISSLVTRMPMLSDLPYQD